MIWNVCVFDNDDPIRALEFEFDVKGEAYEFAYNTIENAKDNVAVTIMKKEKTYGNESN